MDEGDPLAVHVSDSYLKSAAQSGTWADHVIIQAMARTLARDIWIVTSQEQSTSLGHLVTKIECGIRGLNNKQPFLLGHEGEYHYHSLGKANLIIWVIKCVSMIES